MAAENKFPDIAAVFDQFSTTLENFAVLLKTYHDKLAEQGFSKEMTEKLVFDFQNTYWNSTLNPNRGNTINNYHGK